MITTSFTPEIREQITEQYSRLGEFTDFLFADIEGVPHITSRDYLDYNRLLRLDDLPLAKGSKVLEVGAGNSPVSEKNLGEGIRLEKMDISPQLAGIMKGNIINIPAQNDEYWEVWALFVLKYVDRIVSVPDSVQRKLANFLTQKGIETKIIEIETIVLTILGLRALIELLRVTNSSGIIRLASYEYDFNESPSLHLLQIANSNVASDSKPLQIEELTLPSQPDNEKSIIIRKTESFAMAYFQKFLLDIVVRVKTKYGLDLLSFDSNN